MEKAKQIALASDASTIGPPSIPTSQSDTTLAESEKSRSQPPRNAMDNIKDQWRRFTRNSQALPGGLPDLPSQAGQKRGGDSEGPNVSISPPPEGPSRTPELPASGNDGPLLPPPRPSPSRPQTPGPGVTPLNNICEWMVPFLVIKGANA